MNAQDIATIRQAMQAFEKELAALESEQNIDKLRDGVCEARIAVKELIAAMEVK